jgi:hypothetical protein
MRCTAFIAFFFSTLTVLAVDPAPFTPWANKFFVKDNPPPVITHDFGTVPHGTILVHKLTITNIYDVPMQVIDIRKSCTCLEATPPQQVLQPHDTAELTLVMNAGKFSGANTQSFFVTFGPQYVSTAVIRVSANSRSDVTLNPGQLNFGVVALGGKPSQAMTVKYSGKQKDWKITGVVPPTGPFDVQVKENGRGGLLGLGSPEFTVTVSVKEGAAPGPLSETLSLKTNDATAPVVLVSIAGTVQAPVTVSPANVSFGSVKVGQTFEQKVMVRAAKPFTVQPLAETADGLALETFPIAGPVQIVTVKFTPKAAGKFAKTLTLQTDLGPATVSVEGETAP